MSGPPRCHHDIAGKAGPQARRFCISHSDRTPESLTASTPAGWTTQPAASSGGPSQQYHTPQETHQHAFRGEFPTNCPHQLFVLGYTSARYHHTSTLCPSNDPRLRPQDTDANAVQVPVTGSLPDGSAKRCVCASTSWFPRCPLDVDRSSHHPASMTRNSTPVSTVGADYLAHARQQTFAQGNQHPSADVTASGVSHWPTLRPGSLATTTPQEAPYSDDDVHMAPPTVPSVQFCSLPTVGYSPDMEMRDGDILITDTLEGGSSDMELW